MTGWQAVVRAKAGQQQLDDYYALAKTPGFRFTGTPDADTRAERQNRGISCRGAFVSHPTGGGGISGAPPGAPVRNHCANVGWFAGENASSENRLCQYCRSRPDEADRRYCFLRRSP